MRSVVREVCVALGTFLAAACGGAEPDVSGWRGDGSGVYENVQFASSLVACYDFQGQRKWVKVLGISPVIRDGRSASPVLAGDKLLVQMGCLAALNAKTGDVLWRATEAVEGYGTPVVTRLGSQDVAITSNGCVVLVENGKLLARKAAGLNFASPTLGGKYIYIFGNGGHSVVIKPGRKFELVAENRIERLMPGRYKGSYPPVPSNQGAHPECTVSSPIFDGDRIYYQGEGYLYCIGKK